MSLWFAVLFIFLFRTLDVTAETIRTILVVNKYKWLPAAIAFAEVFIWMWIFSEVILSHKHVLVYLAYAAGYSVGTIFGSRLGNHIVTKSKGK